MKSSLRGEGVLAGKANVYRKAEDKGKREGHARAYPCESID